MANSELLDSFADIPALTRQYETFAGYLASLQAQYDTLNKTSINLGGATKGRDIISSLKDAEIATNSYTNASRQAATEFNAMLAASKQNAIDLKNKNLELSAAQKQLTLDITAAKEAARQKAIADKEAAAAELQASKDAQIAGTERILQLKAEQAEQEKLLALEQERNAAEEAALAASANYSNTSTGNTPQAAASTAAFIPVTELEQQAQYLQKNKLALAENQAQQKALTAELKAGTITQAEYDAQINKAILLEAEYKASIAGNTAEIKKLTANEGLDVTSLKAKQIQLAALINEYNLLSEAERKSEAGQLQQSAISTLNTEVLALEASTGRAQRNVGNYGNAITGAFSKAFSYIRQIAYILPGIGIAGIIGLITEPIINFVSKLLEAKTALKDTQETMDESKTSFANAAASVELLKTNIELAKQGFIDKDKVVKEYNDTIGKTTGQVQSLDEAEQALAKNADAYIRFTFLKAAATTALGKAGAEAVQAELDNQKELETVRNLNKPGSSQQDKNAGTDGLSEFLQKGVDNERIATVAANKKRVDQLNKIGADFEKQAADIAKQFNFDFFGGSEDTSVKNEKLKAVNQKFFSDELKDQAEALKALSTDQDLYLTDRLQKRQQAYDIEEELIKKQAANEIKNEADKLAAVNADPKAGVNAKINAENEYAEKVKEINQKTGYQLSQLEVQNDADLLRIRNEFHKKELDSDKASYDEAQKQFAQNDADRLSALADEQARRTNIASQDQKLDVQILNDRFVKQYQAAEGNEEKQKLLQEKYARDRADIEYYYSDLILRQQIDFAEKSLAVQKLASNGQDTKEIIKKEQELADLKTRLSDQTAKHIITNNENVAKNTQDKYKELENSLQQVSDYYGKVSNLISGAVDAATTARKNQIQDEIDLLNQRTKTEIDGINASTASATDKAAQIAIINARQAAQQAELDRQTRESEERKAKYDKALNIGKIIIETALAVVHQLDSGDPYTAIPRAIAAGALGAAELAIAIATPIPKYRTGTQNHPGGLAIVGDGGKRELIQYPDGNTYLSDSKPQLVDMPAYSKVFPDVINARQYLSYTNKPYIPIPANQNVNNNRLIEKKLDKLTAAVIAKPTAVIRNTLGGWQTGYEANQRHVEWVNRLMR